MRLRRQERSTRGYPRVMRVILDTNLWSYIAEREEATALEELEEQLALRLVVPPSILLEVLRTPIPEVRERIVHALTRRGAERVHPSTEARQMADDLVGEIRRLRPQWVRSFPQTDKIERLEKYWTKVIWQRAADDPAAIAAQYDATTMDDEAEQWLEIQHENKLAFTRAGGRVLEIEPVVDLSDQGPDERLGWAGDPLPFWRVHASWFWWLVVSPGRRRISSHNTFRDWLDPFIRRDLAAQDREDWNRLWFYELDAARMARIWITELLPWAQLTARVGGGNPRDVQHAAYLFGGDVFLTADRRLVAVLESLRRWAPEPFARVYCVSGEGSPVAAIAGVLRG